MDKDQLQIANQIREYNRLYYSIYRRARRGDGMKLRINALHTQLVKLHQQLTSPNRRRFDIPEKPNF